MIIDFHIEHDHAVLKFPLTEFDTPGNLEQALAAIIIVSNDFYIDPELTPEQLQELIQGNENPDFKYFAIEIDEEGISAQFL